MSFDTYVDFFIYELVHFWQGNSVWRAISRQNPPGDYDRRVENT